MRIRNLFAPAGVAIALAASSPTLAQTPSCFVVVNGSVMNDNDPLALDALKCGAPLSNGRYWLNMNTGTWCFQGGPQQGMIGAQCTQVGSAPQNPPSRCQTGSWEDRMACLGVEF